MWYENLSCKDVFKYIPALGRSRIPKIQKEGRRYRVFCSDKTAPYDLSIFPERLINGISDHDCVDALSNALKMFPDTRYYLEEGGYTFGIKRPYIHCPKELADTARMVCDKTVGKIYVEWEDLDMIYFLEKIVSYRRFSTPLHLGAATPSMNHGLTWHYLYKNLDKMSVNSLRNMGHLSAVLICSVLSKYIKKSSENSSREEVASGADSVNLF